MSSNLTSIMAILVLAGTGLWILHFFQTVAYIRTSCVLQMSLAVTALWATLLVYTVTILPALSLLELLIVVAIIAILALLLWQAALPSIRKARRALRVLNAINAVLEILGVKAGSSPNSGFKGLSDFFSGSGWDGVSAEDLAKIAKIFNDLIDNEKNPDAGEGFTPTGIYDWLMKNGHEVVAGQLLDKLIERIDEVMEEDDLSDEQYEQLEKFKERLNKIKDAREAAKAAADGD